MLKEERKVKIMKSLKKLVFGALGVVAIAAMIAGCGGSSETASNEVKTLRVGTEATYPPFEFAKANSKEIQGFDVDLMDAIAKQMGTDVKWNNMGFDGLIPGLQSNQLDIVIAGMNKTPDREKAVLFSTPYSETQTVVIHKKGDGINSMADLQGKVVAAQIGTTGSEDARNIKNATAKDFNYVPDILNELKVGGCDAAIIDKPVALYYVKLDGDNYEIFPTGQPSDPVAMAFNSNNKELQEKVNKALKELQENGEFAKIQEKWFGQATPLDSFNK